MTYPIKSNLTIIQGADFNKVWRWGIDPPVYKTITGAAKTAPLRLTVASHGITQAQWPISIANVLGMTKINAVNKPAQTADDYVLATVVDANTLAVNSINAAGYSTYTSGGTIQYPTPATLSGHTARMQIRASVASTTTLLSLTTTDSTLVLSAAQSTIAIAIPAATTAAITWASAVYDLELITTATGAVTRFASGRVKVVKEVTR